VRASFTVAVAAAAALLAAQTIAQQPSRSDGAERVVVFADVHGAYAELVGLLQATSVIDAGLRWSGGGTRLVSLGDLVDRGAQSREVLDLLMRLESEAPRSGGAVHVVLGNHEAMALLGDDRYVAPADYAEFAADEPPALRAEQLARFREDNPELAPEAASAAFDERYPRGYFARQGAFAPGGRYGEWLLSLPSIVVIDGTAFVHGGLPALVASTPLEDLNARNQTALRAAASAATGAGEERAAVAAEEYPGIGADGPLWYRGSVYCKPILEEPVLDAALASVRATSVVVGHTPTEDRRVRELYGGKLLMLDTGMLAQYYRGRPAALLIENGARRVQYVGEPAPVPPEAGPAPLAYGLTEHELGAALATGELAAVEPESGDGRARARVRLGTQLIEAVFYPGDGAAQRELAAYALDRLLGLGLVPLTVAHRVGDRDGALQLVYPDAVSEAARIERRVELAAWCALEPQVELMRAFDALIANPGRTRDNLLLRPELPDLLLVDHRLAFTAARQLPAAPRPIALGPGFRAALAALDGPRLEAALGEWLGRAELRALVARRDALLDAARRAEASR
jgi:calcineurin-like phosphoesterase family protein